MATKSDSITVVVTPRQKDGRVLLHEVQAHLQLLGEAIEAFGGPEIQVEVLSMKMNSPLEVTLRPVKASVVQVNGQIKRRFQTSRSSIRAFEGALAGLQGRGKGHETSDIMALHHLKRFVESAELNDFDSSVQTPREHWDVQPSVINDINRVLTKLSQTNHWERTEVSGRLVRLNTAGTKWTFTVLSAVGQLRVSCDFSPDLLPQVKDAINNFVTVEGMGQFKPGSSFPHRMKSVKLSIIDSTEKVPFTKLFTQITSKASELTEEEWSLEELRRFLG